MKLSEILKEIEEFDREHWGYELVLKTYQPHDEEIELDDGTTKVVEKWGYDMKWFTRVEKTDTKRIENVLSAYLTYIEKLDWDKTPILQVNAIEEDERFVGVIL